MSNEAKKSGGAMSESQYKLKRAEIEKTYPKGQKGLRVKMNALRDQELAKLAHQSGWTQERLAEVEGCNQQMIAFRCRFGRFLEFTTTGSNSEKQPNIWLHDITERKFRYFWEQTEKKDERFRFREVAALIDQNTHVSTTLPKGATAAAVVSKYADGKWHTLEVMAKHFEIDGEIALSAFRSAMSDWKYRGSSSAKWDSRVRTMTTGKKQTQYRIVKGGKKKVNIAALNAEIAPILKGLKEEGKKNMATASPGTVLKLAHELENLLQKMAQ